MSPRSRSVQVAPGVRVHDDRRLPALTGVRFAAALVVLLAHYTVLGFVRVPAEALQLLDGARTAVALFFVLSGFVLAYNYPRLAGRRPVAHFWLGRFARVYPGVLLGLAIGAIGVGVALGDPARLLGWYALKQASPIDLGVSFLAQLTMTTGWFPFARVNQPWNAPAWSIACEAFFYLVFPLVIAWWHRLRPRSRLVVLLGLWALQGLWLLLVQASGNRHAGFVVAQLPLSHLPDFVFGVAAGVWFVEGGREWLCRGARRRVAMVGALTWLAVFSWWQPVQPVYLPLVPAFAVLVLALAAPPASRAGPLGWPPFVVLGEASFALYIIHVPVGNLLQLTGARGWAGWVVTCGVIALSVVVHRAYETPARTWLRRVGGRAVDRSLDRGDGRARAISRARRDDRGPSVG